MRKFNYLAILTFITLILLLLPAINLFADTLYLKDGSVIEGKIISVTDSNVTIENDLGTLIINKENIEKIEFTETEEELTEEEKLREKIKEKLKELGIEEDVIIIIVSDEELEDEESNNTNEKTNNEEENSNTSTSSNNINNNEKNENYNNNETDNYENYNEKSDNEETRNNTNTSSNNVNNNKENENYDNNETNNYDNSNENMNDGNSNEENENYNNNDEEEVNNNENENSDEWDWANENNDGDDEPFNNHKYTISLGFLSFTNLGYDIFYNSHFGMSLRYFDLNGWISTNFDLTMGIEKAFSMAIGGEFRVPKWKVSPSIGGAFHITLNDFYSDQLMTFSISTGAEVFFNNYISSKLFIRKHFVLNDSYYYNEHRFIDNFEIGLAFYINFVGIKPKNNVSHPIIVEIDF